jgi:hypothetical protein
MPESVWPYDIINDPRVEAPPSPHEITCFVLLRSKPKELWDGLYDLIKTVCDQLKVGLQVHEFKVIRATDIASSGVIHTEIWEGIKKADIVIADVTGHNPNVMFELGVTAAAKDKHRVILIKENIPEPEEEQFPFDIMPARHITYSRTYNGFQKLVSDLRGALFDSLAAAPFDAIPVKDIYLPFSAPLCDGHDCDLLWTSDIAYRRLRPNYLGFGSLYHFKSSWMSVGNLKIRNVRVRAEMCFTTHERQDAWIGIMLRSQGFYVDFGYLVHLYPDGRVLTTVPKSEPGYDPQRDVERLGQIENFATETNEFVPFDVQIEEGVLRASVGTVNAVKDMPFVFTRGRILFQTAYTRAGLRNVRVEAL